MDKAQTMVSVIVPCYNQGQYLDEAVKSVLAQTYQDFEIIVVNDGSTDEETLELFSRYNQPKTRIIHTMNQGVSLARNTGIAEAKGKYILPLDADDKIGHTYLEKAVALLEKDETLGIVYCEAEFFGERQGKFDLPYYSFPEILLNNLIPNSAFFRKSDWEQIQGYNPNMLYGWEDYNLWLSILEQGRTVFRIAEVLYFYRQLNVSRSNLANQNIVKCYTQIFRNHEKLYIHHIDSIFQHLVDLREKSDHSQSQLVQAKAELEQVKSQFQQTQAALTTELERSQVHLQQTHIHLQQAHAQLQEAHSTIAAMESSKFWKLRTAWFKLKQALGLKGNE
ncbi:MAG TPA: glycosyltransferase family A protein [Waterburya sp.]|jgi:glycosyltransferase involved in cell wall biosynthesis